MTRAFLFFVFLFCFVILFFTAPSSFFAASSLRRLGRKELAETSAPALPFSCLCRVLLLAPRPSRSRRMRSATAAAFRACEAAAAALASAGSTLRPLAARRRALGGRRLSRRCRCLRSSCCCFRRLLGGRRRATWLLRPRLVGRPNNAAAANAASMDALLAHTRPPSRQPLSSWAARVTSRRRTLLPPWKIARA